MKSQSQFFSVFLRTGLYLAFAAVIASCESGSAAEQAITLPDLSQEFRDVRWSKSTNEVMVGLFVVPKKSDAKFTEYEFQLAFYGTGTNNLIVWFPPEPQRYALELVASNGKAAGKTWRGNKLGQPFKRGSGPLDSRGFLVSRTVSRAVNTIPPLVSLSDLFRIKEAGTYAISGQVRALVFTSGSLSPSPTTFDLPPIRLVIKNLDE